MTIVHSLGAATLVALMSAHRAAAEYCARGGAAFDQATVEAIEAYLRRLTESSEVGATDRAEAPRSYN